MENFRDQEAQRQAAARVVHSQVRKIKEEEGEKVVEVGEMAGWRYNCCCRSGLDLARCRPADAYDQKKENVFLPSLCVCVFFFSIHSFELSTRTLWELGWVCIGIRGPTEL